MGGRGCALHRCARGIGACLFPGGAGDAPEVHDDTASGEDFVRLRHQSRTSRYIPGREADGFRRDWRKWYEPIVASRTRRGQRAATAGHGGWDVPLLVARQPLGWFFAGGKLKKLDTHGGPLIPLADVVGAAAGGSWSPKGIIV